MSVARTQPPICIRCGDPVDLDDEDDEEGENHDVDDEEYCFMCANAMEIGERISALRSRLPYYLGLHEVRARHKKPCDECGKKDWYEGEDWYVQNDLQPRGGEKYCLDCAEAKNWYGSDEDDEDEDNWDEHDEDSVNVSVGGVSSVGHGGPGGGTDSDGATCVVCKLEARSGTILNWERQCSVCEALFERMAREEHAAHVRAKATANRETETQKREDSGASQAGAAGVSKRRKIASTPDEDLKCSLG